MNTDVAHQSRAHSSVVGGSSAARILNCPGSFKLSLTLPRPGSSSFAEEGTALHEAMDVILTDTVEKDTDVIGMTFNGYEITQGLYEEAVEPALEFLDDLYEEVDVEELKIEVKVKFVGIEGAFGTVDVLMQCKDRTIVLDWKFGAGVPVSAENNTQLKFYAYAASVDPRTSGLFKNGKPVELIIVQPRIRDEEARYTRWMTDLPALRVFAKELAEAVEVARNDEEAPFKLGKHCKFCPAEPACPLKNDMVDQALEVSPEHLEDMNEWLTLADKLEDWIAAVRRLAHDELERGVPVPGRKLVPKRASQVYADEEAMARKAKNAFRLDQWSPRKMLTPAQMRKLYKTEDKKFPEEMIVMVSKGNTMVSEDDPRPAIPSAPTALEALGRHLASK